MAEQIKNHVFIVTYGRSGSTVLQKVLQSIPGYFFRGENNHMLYPLYITYRRAHEMRHLHGYAPLPPEEPWYGADEVDPEAFGRRLCKVFSRFILQPPEGTRVLGFKEIRYHQARDDLFEPYLDFIAKNFPGTKFVFNTRRWQEVVKSGWWADMKEENVRALVERADGLFADYVRKNPSNCHAMRYEDFKGNPDAFEGLFDFLGEHFDRQKVEGLIAQQLNHAELILQQPTEAQEHDVFE